MIQEQTSQCFEKQTHDEKPSVHPAVNHSNTHDSDTCNWTAAEERAVVRKIDLTILPLLMLLFFFLQLDRANAGNALTDGFLTDINITQAQYNTGTQLLYAGIVLLELPSNAALFRVGARFWLGGQCFAWGTVATLQAFQHNLAGFYATRALLGLCEAGFIPGALFTLSLWYTNAEISRRFACLFVANALGSACTGLVAYGVLALRGRAGLAGWQWLFVLEGGLTVLASLLFVALFPKSVADPRALVGGGRFSVRERGILRRRVLLDDPSKVSERRHVSGADVLHTLKDWRMWPHLVIAVAGLAPGNALWSYMPSIISSFGYDRLHSNAMTSVGNWINVVVIIIFGILADKTGRRGLIVMLGVIFEFGFMLAMRCITDDPSEQKRYAVLTVASATMSGWHSVNGSWLSIRASSPAERSVRMALFIMAANIGGIVGAFIFRSDDKPYYYRGWTLCTCFAALCVALVACLLLAYRAFDKKEIKAKEEATP